MVSRCPFCGDHRHIDKACRAVRHRGSNPADDILCGCVMDFDHRRHRAPKADLQPAQRPLHTEVTRLRLALTNITAELAGHVDCYDACSIAEELPRLVKVGRDALAGEDI